MPELKVCNKCGVLHAGTGAHCEQCKRRRPKQQATHAHVYNDSRWKALRVTALERDGHRCQQCGSYDRLVVHHIVEVSSRPNLAFELNNLQVLCRRCHRGEHNRRRTHERKLQ